MTTSNFTGMGGGLNISAVLHKACVEVNKEWTEAAAATGVVMESKSIRPPTPVFRAE